MNADLEDFGNNATRAPKSFAFLLSTERSGSNFITSLLNGHSEISGPPPTHLFRLFATNRANYGSLDKDDNWHTLVEDFVLNFEAKVGHWRTGFTADELRLSVRERKPSELLRIVYEKEAEADNARIVFVKENHTYTFAPFLLSHFPDCRFVCLVRDPRDVASSWSRTSATPGGVERAVAVWLQDQLGSLHFCDQLRDTQRVILIRYEDLVNKTVQTLTALTTFLGVPFDETMLSFHTDQRTLENSRRIEAWCNLARPVITGNTRKFPETLSDAELEFVELSCFTLMARFGYSCEVIVDDLPSDQKECRLAELRPKLGIGNDVIQNAEERDARTRRLQAIETVLTRRLQ